MLALLALALLAPDGAPLARGSERVALLPVELREGRNTARQSCPLDTAQGGAVTLCASSLDFAPQLVLRRKGGAVVARGEGEIWSDSWIRAEVQAGDELLLEVSALDARGGEYKLVARDGRQPAPTQAELLRGQRAGCVAAARRAEERHEDARALDCWSFAARQAHMQSDCAAAAEPLGRMLELARRLDAGSERREALLLQALCVGDCATRLAQLQALAPELEAAAKEAGAPARSSLGKRQLAVLYDRLGDAKSELQGMPAAVDDYRRAAAALEGAGSAEQLLAILPKLATALDMAGQAEEADRTLGRLDALAPESAPPGQRAVALAARARIDALRGASAVARGHALQVLALPTDVRLRADMLGTLANACLDLALYEEARARLDELEPLVRACGLRELELPLRRTRAVLAFRLRDLGSAREELRTALEACQRDGDVEGLVSVGIDLALVEHERGDQDAAAGLLDQAIARARDGSLKNLEGRAWLDRGYLFEKQKDLTHAEDAYRRSMEVARSCSDELLVALGDCSFGTLAWMRGDGAGAREHAGRAARRLEQLGFAEEALDARDVLAKQAFSDRDPAALRAEVERASELLAQLERQKLDGLLRSSHRARFAEWSACEQSLVELEPDAPGAAQRGFEAAGRWKGQTLLAELARGLDPLLLTDALSAGKRAWLPADAALLEYVATLDRLAVYVVRPESVERVDLGPREALAAEAQKLGESMSAMRFGASELIEPAAALWKQLVAPALARLPKQVRTLVIVPAPELATLPFEALVSDPKPRDFEKTGEPRCLIDDYLVCHLPASGLAALLAARPARSAPARSLIVADAIYALDERSAALGALRSGQDPGTAGLRRLPRSRDEALALATLLLRAEPGELRARAEDLDARKQGSDAPLAARSFDLYLGASASARVLERDLRAYSDLHLALHVHVDPADPRRSGLVLSPAEGRGSVFTLEEAWRTPLDADLVVLSACSSAKGRVLAGEGVQSLAYAVLHSGARAVVATLWNVLDLDAAAILNDFENERRAPQALHPAQALRKARLAYRSNGVRGPGVSAGPPAWNPWPWAGYLYIGAPPR